MLVSSESILPPPLISFAGGKYMCQGLIWEVAKSQTVNFIVGNTSKNTIKSQKCIRIDLFHYWKWLLEINERTNEWLIESNRSCVLHVKMCFVYSANVTTKIGVCMALMLLRNGAFIHKSISRHGKSDIKTITTINMQEVFHSVVVSYWHCCRSFFLFDFCNSMKY